MGLPALTIMTMIIEGLSAAQKLAEIQSAKREATEADVASIRSDASHRLDRAMNRLRETD